MKPYLFKGYYEDVLTKTPNYYHQEVERCLVDGSIVLDAGCGSGEYGVLKEKGGRAGRIVGVDISEEALKNNAVIDDYVVSDLVEIPLEDNTFDMIVCEGVIEHLEHPEKVISEFSRLLKSGGYVVLRTWNIWHLNNFLSALLPVGVRRRLKGWLIKDSAKHEGTFETYYRCNSRKRMGSLFCAAGFEEEKFILHRDSILYWDSRLITSFFTIYEKVTDFPKLGFAKMHLVAVYKSK